MTKLEAAAPDIADLIKRLFDAAVSNQTMWAYSNSEVMASAVDALTTLQSSLAKAQGERDEAKQAAAWQTCPTHGKADPATWGCPECVREMRAELASRAASCHIDGCRFDALQAQLDEARNKAWGPVRYMRCYAYPGEEECSEVSESALAALGDTILVWVSESDILMAGQEFPRRALKATP